MTQTTGIQNDRVNEKITPVKKYVKNQDNERFIKHLITEVHAHVITQRMHLKTMMVNVNVRH